MIARPKKTKGREARPPKSKGASDHAPEQLTFNFNDSEVPPNGDQKERNRADQLRR